MLQSLLLNLFVEGFNRDENHDIRCVLRLKKLNKKLPKLSLLKPLSEYFTFYEKYSLKNS